MKNKKFYDFVFKVAKFTDFAGEDGTVVKAIMRTTSLSNVSHVDRVEDEDRNEGRRM